MLISLDQRLRGCRFPNKEIQAYLPNKTLKQISDKRRCLYEKYTSSVENNELHDEVPREVRATHVQQQIVETAVNMNQTGKNAIYNYIDSIEISAQSKFMEVEVLLKTTWKNSKDDPDALPLLLDKIINEKIVPKLLKIKVNNKNKNKRNNNKSTIL